MIEVFEQLDARMAEIGELLESARRYRPLATETHELYLTSSRIGSRLRQASRAPAAGNEKTIEDIGRELESALRAGRVAVEQFLAGSGYRDLAASLQAGDTAEAALHVCEIFADIEPVSGVGLLYYPLTGKREEGILEPEAGIERIRRMTGEGLEPSRAPGVGGDSSVHPVRLYEGAEGLDAAVFLLVRGDDVNIPLFRATGIGEVLVYTPKLRVPFEVGLRSQSPDDWLEARPGGYAKYRDRWRALLRDGGFTVREV